MLRPLLSSTEALWYGVIYLRIVALSFFPYAISSMLCAALKSTERVVLPMVASFAGAAIDALMSYVLIFGKFGAPRLEVTGAAAGSVLGVLAELVILAAVGFGRGYIKLRFLASLFKIPVEFIRKFMKIVLPVVAMKCSGRWASSPIRPAMATCRTPRPRRRRSSSTATSSSWRR